MDPFVRRLVQRLLDPARPLSRNRHFSTFSSSEGRAALRVTRRLRSLQRDLETCRAEGGRPRVAPSESGDGREGWRIELALENIRGSRSIWLPDAEYQLLRSIPGIETLL